jgi:hypothetical protein
MIAPTGSFDPHAVPYPQWAADPMARSVMEVLGPQVWRLRAFLGLPLGPVLHLHLTRPQADLILRAAVEYSDRAGRIFDIPAGFEPRPTGGPTP